MIPVYNSEGQQVAEIPYNDNLDPVGLPNNGRHKGLAVLPDGGYVLIHGSEFDHEKNYAEIIPAERALREIIRSGNSYLFERHIHIDSSKAALEIYLKR